MTDTNNTPTLEDVDAELQPKGLPVITLTAPFWIGDWVCEHPDFWTRWLLQVDDGNDCPALTRIELWLQPNNAWRYTSAGRRVDRCRPEGHPTPEAAQAACEAAIVAAWRNR